MTFHRQVLAGLIAIAFGTSTSLRAQPDVRGVDSPDCAAAVQKGWTALRAVLEVSEDRGRSLRDRVGALAVMLEFIDPRNRSRFRRTAVTHLRHGSQLRSHSQFPQTGANFCPHDHID